MGRRERLRRSASPTKRLPVTPSDEISSRMAGGPLPVADAIANFSRPAAGNVKVFGCRPSMHVSAWWVGRRSKMSKGRNRGLDGCGGYGDLRLAGAVCRALGTELGDVIEWHGEVDKRLAQMCGGIFDMCDAGDGLAEGDRVKAVACGQPLASGRSSGAARPSILIMTCRTLLRSLKRRAERGRVRMSR
jgi:hypothetical protein